MSDGTTMKLAIAINERLRTTRNWCRMSHCDIP